MKYIVAIALMVSLSSCHQVEKRYYKDSGKVSMKIITDDGQKTFNEYYESGQLKNSYKHSKLGQLDGDNISYFENGTISVYYHWNNGVPEGRIYANYPNGTLAHEKYFKNGFRADTSKYYNADGKVSREQIFEENKCRWDDETEIAKNKFYRDGQLAYIEDVTDYKTKSITVVNEAAYNSMLAKDGPSGVKLFRQNCAACHAANIDIVGPMMHGIAQKRTTDWLYKMITNGDDLVKNGDKTAIALYEKWHVPHHPNFEILNTAEMSALMDYIKTL